MKLMVAGALLLAACTSSSPAVDASTEAARGLCERLTVTEDAGALGGLAAATAIVSGYGQVTDELTEDEWLAAVERECPDEMAALLTLPEYSSEALAEEIRRTSGD